jgi:hypothetical protein
MVAKLCEEEVYGEELVRIGTKRGWKRRLSDWRGNGRWKNVRKEHMA